MKWYQRLYRTRARKYLLIGLLSAFLPVGAAVTIGGSVDGALEEIFTEAGESAE